MPFPVDGYCDRILGLIMLGFIMLGFIMFGFIIFGGCPRLRRPPLRGIGGRCIALCRSAATSVCLDSWTGEEVWLGKSRSTVVDLPMLERWI